VVGILLVGAALPVFAAPAAPPNPACALVKACALDVVISNCTADQSRPVRGVEYDALRCAEPRDLLAHGVAPSSGVGAFAYAFLGRRYRVVYDIEGEAPISEARFDYLAENLPLAAHLASDFSKTKYTVQYLDPLSRRFHASRADKLTGDAELLFLDVPEKRRVYYGWGSSKVGPWRLRGSAYVEVRVRPTQKGIAYEVRIRTAPVNAMVNVIMRLGLFKDHVIGEIQGTMKDLIGAAAALSPEGLEMVLANPGFTPEERVKVRALVALPE
jgi:hypothetical protein